MDDQKMEIIKQLMSELEGLMQPDGDELGERLGRPKMDMTMDMDDGGPMDGDDDEAMEGDLDEDPADKFKSRLMKLRG